MPKSAAALREVDHVNSILCAVLAISIAYVVGPEAPGALEVNCQENVVAPLGSKLSGPHGKFFNVDNKGAVLSLAAFLRVVAKLLAKQITFKVFSKATFMLLGSAFELDHATNMLEFQSRIVLVFVAVLVVVETPRYFFIKNYQVRANALLDDIGRIHFGAQLCWENTGTDEVVIKQRCKISFR